MNNYSQIPGRPSFRDSAIHAVAIVPLTIPRGNYVAVEGGAGAAAAGTATPTTPTTITRSEKSFYQLLNSLEEYASSSRTTHRPSLSNSRRRRTLHRSSGCTHPDESDSSITLIVPHSQLTRPGDWRYDATPLKSHDWTSGCQRMRVFDGRPEYCRMAIDRIGNHSPAMCAVGHPTALLHSRQKSKTTTSSSSSSSLRHSDPWRELEPYRKTSAVIGVLNLKDCRDNSDLWRAEKCLISWARAYASSSDFAEKHAQNNTDNNGDNEEEDDDDDSDVTLLNNQLTIRLFVFDSFDETTHERVDLSQTKYFRANQLVAFPPMLDFPSSKSNSSSCHGSENDGNINTAATSNSQMMVLHWNVVVNDLAVTMFRNVERSIRENDALRKSNLTAWNNNKQLLLQQQQRGGVGGASSSGSGSAGRGAGPPSQLPKGGTSSNGQQQSNEASFPYFGQNNSDKQLGDDTSSVVSSTSNETYSITTTSAITTASQQIGGGPGGGLGVGGRLKNALDSTRKAITNRENASATVGIGSGFARGKSTALAADVGGGVTSPSMPGIVDHRRNIIAKLVTPLDLDANNDDIMSSISARDVEALKRRDMGRREKRGADLSLLAGSPIDAYERYTHAAELTRHSHDPLWYASALEGCACAFIAMADVGGHGVDEYLENNFQLPEEIMALAIAQGVAAGTDLGDGKGKTMTVDRTKTTLPQAVTALIEESMSVLCRHKKLAPLHAGLLMKLAEYVQEQEEGHLRCRWGEGDYCYGGDMNSMSGECTPPRWERTSVSKLDLRGTEVRDMLALDSIERGRKFTELLHRAVSVGGLDDRSRADVAAACARACLIGTRVTQWGDSTSNSTASRLRFPRKAAFFTLVAAEAMSRCDCDNAAERVSRLYLAASHLYSSNGNVFEHGDECTTRYGWATLRVASLQGLASQPANMEAAEAATEVLIALMSEVSENYRPHLHGEDEPSTLGDNVMSSDSAEYDRQQLLMRDDSHHGSQGNSSDGKTKQVSRPLASMSKAPFFAQAPPSALSLLQSKWLEDDPVPHLSLPFIFASNGYSNKNTSIGRALIMSSTIASMNCVTSKISFEKCAQIQQMCMANIQVLRQKMGASSAQDSEESANFFSLPSPLVVTSAKIVKGDSNLLLERTKALGYSAKFAAHSMSTFYNPFAKNKEGKEKNKIMTILIAEGEERTIMIEFKNRLAVSLDVPSCQLEFEGDGADRIEAPPLSFSVPAKTNSFAVHFPFNLVASKIGPDILRRGRIDCEKILDEAELVSAPDMFEITGVRVTFLNRTFSIRFSKCEEGVVNNGDITMEHPQLPPAAGIYQRSKHTQPKKDVAQMVVRLESVPAQPNLLVSFASSQSPMEEDSSVPIHLSDGEIVTLPPFRLENDFGRSGLGEIERLQVLAVGLPGIPDETLFDTDALAAALEEEEDVLTETDSEIEEDFEEMMDCDGLPPLKMKVIAEGLNLRSINDKSKNKGEGSIVKFQIAATHDMGDQLSNGGNVRIRFRYRGPSPNPATEIWRKREISLRIIRVKGPRISSLTFRSDLSWGSSYTELCKSLAMQRRQLGCALNWGVSNNRAYSRSRSASFNSQSVHSGLPSNEVENSILSRVGMDKCIHVSSDEIVLLMAVANETNSTIILSNRKGLVGGFEGSPMPTVRIASGVSVKIPVVIPRIARFDGGGDVTDLAAELVSLTALQWESEVMEGSGTIEKVKRTGRVRIPSRCLREVIDEHQSFASRICTPPVSLNLFIGDDANLSEISVPIGSPIEVKAIISFQDWVPTNIVAKCKVTLEFCCAEKQSGKSSSSDISIRRMPYMWCGQLRRTADITKGEGKTHYARIVLLECGVFVVSVCATLSSQDAPSGVGESWWAPRAKVVRVGELEGQ